jgi:hypothetical protein
MSLIEIGGMIKEHDLSRFEMCCTANAGRGICLVPSVGPWAEIGRNIVFGWWCESADGAKVNSFEIFWGGF